ncbi:MAG: YggS family pyridoxal phosphate-dependent enzyme [Gammaproteobacteria bacterium]|nr:YggS family pyridoxal phosphate-dependent enzyme [Gammaproteobacteria bacterium]
MSNTRNRFDHINHRIQQAFNNSGRSLSKPVTLLAVSKHHSLEKIQAFYDLGQRDFGESYLQEAIKKINQSTCSDIIWHFIGPIQSNKTKEIAQHFQWVHSVDRIKIARRLSAQYTGTSKLNICLQINISQEPQKSGFSTNEIASALEEIIQLPNLNLRGLMSIPKPSNDFTQQSLAFHQLRELMEQLNKQFALNMDTLSMGMSGDLEAAISEGATIIRVGTALFGPRES